MLSIYQKYQENSAERKFREKGNEVGSGAISSTVFGLSSPFCAFFKSSPIFRFHPETIFSLSSASHPLLSQEECNCCFFCCYLHCSPQREEERRRGIGMTIKDSPRVVGASWKAVPGVRMPACASQENW